MAVKSYLKNNPLLEGDMVGSISELEPSPSNIDLAKSDVVDNVTYGKVVECGYAIDGYKIVFYAEDFIIHDQPNIFSFIKRILIFITRKDRLTIRYEDVIRWYIDKENKYVAIKSFIREKKRDLIVITYVLGTSAKDLLTQKISSKFTDHPFGEPGASPQTEKTVAQS